MADWHDTSTERPAERRRAPRRAPDPAVSPYMELFTRIADALEGIEKALAESDPIVLPDTGPLQEPHPRR